MRQRWKTLVCGGAVMLASACGDYGNDADKLGVGAECANDDDCLQVEGDAGFSQQCLTQFTGGYCGLEDCTDNAGCPEGSACVRHTDATNYCFRTCRDKSECNVNRSSGNEANCSANVDFVEGKSSTKACVPPSSGS